jgi:hypothetical protein
MDRKVIVAVAMAAALAIIVWRSTTSAPTAKLDLVAEPSSPRVAEAVQPIDAVAEQSPSGNGSDPAAPESANGDSPRDDGAAFVRHLDAIAQQADTREFRNQADRLFAQWMNIDAPSALTWLERHRGDARFDRLVANAAQMYLAAGDVRSAQTFVEQIVEPSTREWLNEEVWAAAFEKRLVSADDLEKSGLTPDKIIAIVAGSRRD